MLTKPKTCAIISSMEKLKLKEINRIFDNICFDYVHVKAYQIENGMFKGYFLAPLGQSFGFNDNPLKIKAMKEFNPDPESKRSRAAQKQITENDVMMFCTDPTRGFWKGVGTKERPYEKVNIKAEYPILSYQNTGYSDWFLFKESADELQKMDVADFDEELSTKLIESFAEEYYRNCAYRDKSEELLPLKSTDVVEFLLSFHALPESLLKSRRAISRLTILMMKKIKGEYAGSVTALSIADAYDKLKALNKMLNESNEAHKSPAISQVIYGE